MRVCLDLYYTLRKSREGYVTNIISALQGMYTVQSNIIHRLYKVYFTLLLQIILAVIIFLYFFP